MLCAIQNRKQVLSIIGLVILGCVIMAITEAIIQPGYVVKSIIKVIFFLGIPIGYARLDKESHINKVMELRNKGIGKALLLGIAVYILILIAYLIVRNFYDFSVITALLGEKVGVQKDNFLYVALYISICNSWLEEFFFRGFAFLTLKQVGNQRLAYLFSSIAFALYHVAIMNGWFSPILFVLSILGLTIGGLLFNWLDSKTSNLYNSWTVHMFANLAINTIGCMLFGIL